MPRVPQIQTATGQIGSTRSTSTRGTIALANQMAGLFDQTAQITFDAQNRIQKAARDDQFIVKTAEFNRGVAEIQLTADSPEQFREESKKLSDKIFKGIDDPVVAREFANRSFMAIDSINTTLVATQGREQRAENRSMLLNGALPQYAESAARATITGNDVEEARNRADFNHFVDITGHFSDTEKPALRAAFEEKSQKDTINMLISKALADPANSDAPLAEASARLAERFTPNISPEDRATLSRSVRSAAKGTRLQTSNALKEAQRASANGFIARMHSRDPADFPSVSQVVDSPLDRIEKEHFIQLIEDHNSGKDVLRGSPLVEAELNIGVNDQNSFNRITSVDQLTPFLGNGLGTVMYDKLQADLNRLNGKQQSINDKQFSAFLTSIKPVLIQASIIPNSDPAGAAAFNDFSLRARELFDEGLKQGKRPEDMLASSGKDAIRNILPQFTVSATDKVKIGNEVSFPSAPVTKTKLVRKKDETASEFAARLLKEQAQE